MFTFMSKAVSAMCLNGANAKVSSSTSGRRQIDLLVLGLDGSGKTTVCHHVHGKLDKPVLPTVGHTKFEPISMNGYEVTLHDLGGMDGAREMWKTYFAKSYGVVFVSDASDSKRFEEAQKELRKVLSDPKMSIKPLLVVANKQDRPNAESAYRLAKTLKLTSGAKDTTAQMHLVIECDARDQHFHTIQRGLEWIVSTIDSRYDGIRSRVLTDVKAQEENQRKADEEREQRVKEVKEKRELVVASALAENPDGDEDIQVCLECNDAVATTKSKASSFRPVCEACNKKLKAVYKKKYGGIRCLICDEKAVSKNGKVGWKPVCQTCDDRLNAGESKEDILASPSPTVSNTQDDENEESKTSSSSSSSSSNQSILVGTYNTQEGDKEHIRIVNDTYQLFNCEDESTSWGVLKVLGKGKSGDALDVTVTTADDGSTFTGTVVREQTGTVQITWSDGDRWIRKASVPMTSCATRPDTIKTVSTAVSTKSSQREKAGSDSDTAASPKKSSSSTTLTKVQRRQLLSRLVGEWFTSQHKSETVQFDRSTTKSLEVLHTSPVDPAEKIMWAKIKIKKTGGVSLKTIKGEKFKGEISGEGDAMTIQWSDGDKWTRQSGGEESIKTPDVVSSSVPRETGTALHAQQSATSPPSNLSGEYRTAEGNIESLQQTSLSSYRVYLDGADTHWGTIEKVDGSSKVRLTDKSDGATYGAEIKRVGDAFNITWEDGDVWTHIATATEREESGDPTFGNNIIRRCAAESKVPLQVD